MQDIRRMQIGQVVDFCIEYNRRQQTEEESEHKEHRGRRNATQKDIDAFLG